MITLHVSNYDLTDDQVTLFSSAASAGASVATVENSTGFAADDFLAVGNYRSEGAELRKISTVPNVTTITVTSAFGFAHAVDEAINKIPFDQVIMQESTDGLTGWSDVATKSIAVDSNVTIITYSSGASNKYYRTYFKNSASLNISEYSGAIPGTGFAIRTLGWLQKECARKFRDPNYDIISPEDWTAYVNEAHRRLYPRFAKPASGKTITGLANTYEYSLPSGIDIVTRIRYNETSATTSPRNCHDARVFNGKLFVQRNYGTGYTFYLDGYTVHDTLSDEDDTSTVPVEGIDLVVDNALIIALEELLADKAKLNQYAAEIKEVTEGDVMNLIDQRQRRVDKRLKELQPAITAINMPSNIFSNG